MIFSTHVMESAERLCNEIALIDRGAAVLSGPVAEVKKKYGSNTVQIEFDGDDSFVDQLPGVTPVRRDNRYMEVNLDNGADAQQLLQHAAQRVQIRRFEVMQPTLHNIFIEKVGPVSEEAEEQHA